MFVQTVPLLHSGDIDGLETECSEALVGTLFSAAMSHLDATSPLGE